MKHINILQKVCMSFLFCLLMIYGSATVRADENKCGENAYWNIDASGTLKISGSGPMEDYVSWAWRPWDTSYGSVKAIRIESGITHIGNNAFNDLMGGYYGENDKDAGKVRSIYIASTVTSIGESAFASNFWIENITIPSSVTSIGEHCFDNCKRLKSINITNGITKIEDGTFNECISLSSIAIPNKVTEIGKEAFRKCSSLSNIAIPSSVTIIHKAAFQGCTRLNSFTFPASIQKTGEFILEDCTRLRSVYFCGNPPLLWKKYNTDSHPRIFWNIETTAYYPYNNAQWNKETRQVLAGGDGKITWAMWNPSTGTVIKENDIKHDLSKATITLSKTTYKYDGKIKTPSVTVKYNGKKLSTSDYSVTYKDNRYAGTATVEVIGKGNYSGTVKKAFTITAGKKIPIIFNGNGGKASKAKINVSIGAKYGTLPTAKLKGYKFLGWFTSKKGGKRITKTSYVEIKKKQTLYAQWKKENYTISYNLNGGNNSKKNPNTYTVSTKTFSLANPTRKGYVFKGWYTDSKYKKSISKINKGTTGTKTLYAKWSPVSYSIKFDGNGVLSKKMTSMKSLKYGVYYKLKKNTYIAPKGKQFKEWNTKKNGSGKSYKNQETFSNLTTKNGSTIKLYAQWEPVRYKIKYVMNGGTNNSKNITSFNTKEKKKIKNGSRIGYIFAGWYTKSNLTGKSVTSVDQLPAQNVTLYAKWKPITYTIHFDGNGWLSNVPQDISCKYDVSITIPSVDSIGFGGWSINQDGTGTRYIGGETISNLLSTLGTVTFYAQRSETKVVVTNYLEGVSLGKIRYVYQLGDYVSNGWGKYSNNAGKGGDGDPRWECGFATQSMALSYIGKDVSPEWLCDQVSTNYASNYGIAGVSSTSGSGATSGSTAYQRMNAMLDFFIKDGNKGIYSPVIVHYTNGNNMHTILVVGKNIDGSYIVLDTARSLNTYSLTITSDGVIPSGQNAPHGGSIDRIQQYQSH